jgi:hypothetical protein
LTEIGRGLFIERLEVKPVPVQGASRFAYFSAQNTIMELWNEISESIYYYA